MPNQKINMPAERPSLLAFLAACKPSDIDFPDIDNLPPLDDVLAALTEKVRLMEHCH